MSKFSETSFIKNQLEIAIKNLNYENIQRFVEIKVYNRIHILLCQC